jgi:hypothetical protein
MAAGHRNAGAAWFKGARELDLFTSVAQGLSTL